MKKLRLRNPSPKPKKNKGYLSQFFNERDKLTFYLVITYRRSNTFLTFYYRNHRVNRTFILYKLSCGFVERKTSKLSKFQRNRFRYTFGLMRPRIIRMYRYMSYVFYLHPNLLKNNLYIHWNITRIDNNILLIINQCSFLEVLEDIVDKVELKKFERIGKHRKLSRFGKREIKYYKLNKFSYEFINRIYTRYFFKLSHNGCRLSKHRFIKKKRAKKALNIKRYERTAMFQTLNRLTKFD